MVTFAAQLSSSTNFNKQLFQSTVRPTGMWILCGAPGGYSSAYTLAPVVCDPTISLTSINMTINGINYLNQPLISQYDSYNLLKFNMEESCQSKLTGNHLSFNDFSQGYRFYFQDLTRLKLLDENTPCTIQYQATLLTTASNGQTVSTTYDMYVLLDRTLSWQEELGSNAVVNTVTQGAR